MSRSWKHRRWAGLAGALALAGPATAAPLTAGFYLPWDDASTASLTAHAGALSVVSPMSGALDTAQGHIRWQPDAALPPALKAARAKPRVFPIISNAHDEVWDVAAAEAAMGDPAAGKAMVAELLAQAAARNYGGYILDFENLTPKGLAAYAPFLAGLHAALKPAGRELWVTATMSADPAFLRALARSTDAVVLMAYDQCWATSTPGPVAGNDWLADALRSRLADLNPSQVILALGAYGYDWPQGGVGAVVSASQAQALAQTRRAAVIRNAPNANPHFAYQGSDGRPHQVWWLDAAAFRTQSALAAASHVRGVAIWRLGLEDPALWKSGGQPPKLTPAAPPPACNPLPH